MAVCRCAETLWDLTSVAVIKDFCLMMMPELAEVDISSQFSRLIKTHDFVDIDECQGTSHGCIQLCTNTVGSYMCGCQIGFQLHGDGQRCNGEFTAQTMNLQRQQQCALFNS